MEKYFEWFGLPGKLVLTLLLSLLALVMVIVFPTSDRVLCLVAMLFSSAGDIVLMNYKKIGDRMLVPYFFVGAVLFMISHVFYFFAFFSVIRGNGYSYLNAGVFGVAALIIMIAAAFGVTAFRRGHCKINVFLLLCIYLMIIGINCATICSFSYSAGGTAWIAAVGALSFLISDLIIGLERLLGVASPRLRAAIWWFYPIGQILILLRG